jgi:hypothetical protein
MRLSLAIALATLAPAAAFPVVCGNAQTPQGNRDEQISSMRAAPGEGRASEWTPERIQGAQSVPLPVADPEAVRRAFRARRNVPQSPGATENGAPSPVGRQSGNVRFYPLTMAGRLFFNANSDQPGWGHICTAQFVAPNILLTASHCVQDLTPPFAYHRNYMFSLEYEQGAAAGRYGFRCQANLKGWAQENEARWLYDYAMIQTDRPAEVGWFGLQWNWLGLFNSATKIGYPSGNFNSEVIQVDSGPLSVTDGLVELKHGNVHVQHGSSGGAWVGDYSTNSRASPPGNHIISSESFSQGEAGETSGISYGPYYTDSIYSLYKYVQKGCHD